MAKTSSTMIVSAAWIAVAASMPAYAETKLEAGSSWVNDDGSVLSISTIAPNGLLTGTFMSMTGCGAKQAQPVTGWYSAGSTGGALTFSVAWDGCNAVTTWTGQYSNATGRFQTLWYYTAAAAPAWNGIVAGSHTFVPQPAPRKL
jgi:Avidin family